MVRTRGQKRKDLSSSEELDVKSQRIIEEPTSVDNVNRRICPYLGTINRHVLDFDFEKICSVSLATNNIYACLICGKYYQGNCLDYSGRGQNTYCNTHALEESHYLFINLKDSKIYCLPDNYQVLDVSLNDIKKFLNPAFSKDDIDELDSKTIYGKALDGTDFIPGIVGLNNLNKTDCFNVIIQVRRR